MGVAVVVDSGVGVASVVGALVGSSVAVGIGSLAHADSNDDSNRHSSPMNAVNRSAIGAGYGRMYLCLKVLEGPDTAGVGSSAPGETEYRMSKVVGGAAQGTNRGGDDLCGAPQRG